MQIMNQSTLDKIENDISTMIGQHIENSKQLQLTNNQELFRTKTSYFKMIISSIVLGAIPGLLSAIDVLIHPEDHLLIPIIVVVLSCISSILLSIIKYRNYDQNILEKSKTIEQLNQTMLRLQEHQILLPSKTTQSQLQDTLYAVTHIINPSLHSKSIVIHSTQPNTTTTDSKRLDVKQYSQSENTIDHNTELEYEMSRLNKLLTFPA